jgi:hypothetical protein
MFCPLTPYWGSIVTGPAVRRFHNYAISFKFHALIRPELVTSRWHGGSQYREEDADDVKLYTLHADYVVHLRCTLRGIIWCAS